MILTGPEIRSQIEMGKELHGKPVTIRDHGEELPTGRTLDKMNYIDIDPYDESLVGPNSVDLRLGDKLLVYEGVVKRFEPYKDDDPRLEMESPVYHDRSRSLDMRGDNPTLELPIPYTGIILRPGILYLGRTIETIGSNSFVPIVEGRSSVGRLGIHVHVTAGFCDLGFRGTITLEIHVLHSVRIYPNVPICQAYFLRPEGEIELYKGRYQDQVEPTASRFGVKLENEDE